MALSPANSPARTLIAIDLTRFACAMLVVAFHYGGFLTTHASGLTAVPGGLPWQDAVQSGWIGVELFFVLSGFVIAWSAEGSRSAAFLWRRARRLLPAAWLCSSITATALLALADVPTEVVLRRWLASATFDPVATSIDPSYWTLAIEVNFYLAVTLVLAGGGTADRMERFAVALGCASLTYWIAGLIVDVPPMHNRLAQLTLLPHGCFFAIGVLIRAIQRDGATAARIATMALFGIAAGIEIITHGREFSLDPAAVGWAMATFAIGVATILLAERTQPWLARRLRPGTAAAIGLTTYPLYLLHQLLGKIGIDALVAAGWPLWPAAAATLAATLCLAWIVARHGEPAIRALLGRVACLTRRRVPVPDSPSIASPSAG